MSSPRLVASLLAVSAALVIVSCGDQFSPTVPSPMAQTTIRSGATEFFDNLADPTVPNFGVRDDAPAPPPIVYPPNTPPDPWPPGPPPKAQPGVAVPTEPSTNPLMHIRIEPEPVTHSGVPIAVASCATNHPYTWYYDQVIINDSGLALTLTQRENFFDGRYSSTNPQVIQIRANGAVTLHTAWCSGYAKPHYTQTRYTGRDESGNPIVFSGPWVRLLTP
jgi:hypothetical protein